MRNDAGREQRIQTLFLHPVELYDLADVARLTGMPLRKLRREVAGGYRDGLKVRGAWRFTWQQAACLALERWTLAEIHEALGDDASAVLPPLLSLRSVTLRLPEYVLRALETIAAEHGVTMDHALYGELLDFAGTLSGRMEATVPGYRRAYLFPGRE
ncbi:MAG TPA: hypothetical protein VNA69_16020 [Thermoanaerobaculia bacterium]|nr:hypothetical protein [Thermoanaerobaculia bacterium]